MKCPECKEMLAELQWTHSVLTYGTLSKDGKLEEFHDRDARMVFMCPDCNYELEVDSEDEAVDLLNYEGTYDQWIENCAAPRVK